GTPEEIMSSTASLTGAYLSGRKRVHVPEKRRQPRSRWLEIKNAREHNLRGVNARFPVGLLTCVTGVSGSGKSTLVNDTLLRALAAKLHGAKAPPGAHDRIE